jgi:hypothetical protein
VGWGFDIGMVKGDRHQLTSLNPEAPVRSGVVVRTKRAAISFSQMRAVGFVAPSILVGCLVDLSLRCAVSTDDLLPLIWCLISAWEILH